MTNNVIDFLEKTGLNVIVLDGKNDEEILGLKKKVMKKTKAKKTTDKVFNEAMKELLEKIEYDFVGWKEKCNKVYKSKGWKGNLEVSKNMIVKFAKGLDWNVGRKYAKVTKYTNEKSHQSVWGFVALKDCEKFKCGDILMAKTFNSPTTNKARGNIFEDYKINWTGPNYLN